MEQDRKTVYRRASQLDRLTEAKRLKEITLCFSKDNGQSTATKRAQAQRFLKEQTSCYYAIFREFKTGESARVNALATPKAKNGKIDFAKWPNGKVLAKSVSFENRETKATEFMKLGLKNKPMTSRAERKPRKPTDEELDRLSEALNRGEIQIFTEYKGHVFAGEPTKEQKAQIDWFQQMEHDLGID